MANYNLTQLEQLWDQQGGNPTVAPVAAAIALAESGGNPGAYNPKDPAGGSRGLWQINGVHGAQSTFDPAANARAAVAISGNGTNWTPWTTYTSGAYRQFLPGASPGDTQAPIPGAVATLTSAQSTAASDCIWSAPGLPSWVPIIGGSPGCILSRQSAETLKGLALVLTAGIVGLVGVWMLSGGQGSKINLKQIFPQSKGAPQASATESAEAAPGATPELAAAA